MKETLTFPVAQIEIHTKVKEIIVPLLAGKKMKVADAAAGNGYMTQWLLEHDAEVMPFDMSSSDWKVPTVQCHYSNFDKRIEVEDNVFDLVISIETIEHLENPFHFIREISRITRPNGIVVITTPNVHGIRSRLKFLFCGLPTLFEYVEDDKMGQHISPVSIGQFLYAFKMANLRLLNVYSVGPKPSRAVSICLSLLNAIASLGTAMLKVQRKSQDDFYLNVLSNAQSHELNNDVSLIVVAQKSGSERK
jgi:2-polyprenyl-3-methyl-5-hydroxy-6-metoxy-1,4-benzoquinol methylase